MLLLVACTADDLAGGPGPHDADDDDAVADTDDANADDSGEGTTDDSGATVTGDDSGTPPGPAAPTLVQTGSAPLFDHDGYDYVPAVIQDGSAQRFWWCGGPAPTDVVYTVDADASAGTFGAIRTALEPTPGAWDAAYVCDPSVIRGAFPYGDHTWAYAMYYTGTTTTEANGIANRVGVAFSDDAVTWTKAPDPVIYPTTWPTSSYGTGETAVLSGDGAAEVWLWAVDTSSGTQVVNLYHALDGVTFELVGPISTTGIDGGFVTELDVAYDYATTGLYLVTDRVNDTSALDLYWIPWDEQLTGTWTRVASITSATTGAGRNEGAGFLRNGFGNPDPFLPALVVYFATGSAEYDPYSWNLAWVAYEVR